QLLFQPGQPGLLLLGQLSGRDPGGPGDHLGDVIAAHFGDLGSHTPLLVDLLLQLVDLVAQLGGALVVLHVGRLFLVQAQLFDLLLQLAHPVVGIVLRVRFRAPAWSIRSIALSGRFRSVKYRSESSAAAAMASSVNRTWWCAS